MLWRQQPGMTLGRQEVNMVGNRNLGISNGSGMDEEGYDESQGAEILEVMRGGPSDGVLLTDVFAGESDDPEDEPIDDLDMEADEVGIIDADALMSEDAMDEDDVQDDFDTDSLDEDLDDRDDVALRP
jgi:DNA-directed RNA polymerase subunit delta